VSFLVRQISHAADGREIVRAQEYASQSINVGRDSACEIHLADLGVELRHATLTLQGRRLVVEAIGGLGFEASGRKVMRADISLSDGDELKFGGHLLKVSADGDKAVIVVERAAAISEASEEKEEIGLFTLKGKLPGKRLSAWLLALTILVVGLGLPIKAYMDRAALDRTAEAQKLQRIHADTIWSSGPLSLAHKGLSNNCAACHTKAFVAVEDKTCTSCHKDTHDHAPMNRLINAKGPPGQWEAILQRVATAFNRPQGRCVECHTEHEGAGPMPKTAQAFCTSCHEDLSDRLKDTKIGDAGDFGNAHPQFKARVTTVPGARPKIERISLSNSPKDNGGLKFPHKLHLALGGGVARMSQTLGGSALACKDCHTPTADGVRFQPVDMEKNCSACHSLGLERIGGTVRTLRHGDPKMVVADLRAYYRSTVPPRPSNLGGMARRRPGAYAQGQVYNAYFGAVGARFGRAEMAIRQVFSEGGACYDCHTIAAPARGSDGWKVTPVNQVSRYFEKGWFDHGPHETEKCSSCHTAATSEKATDLLIPGIKTCRSCHGGEGDRFSDVPSSCAMCHSYHIGEGAPWQIRKQVDRAFITGLSPKPNQSERE
jgi:predicted CXXCH cytochrome family protein